jgi:hypothetical protein
VPYMNKLSSYRTAWSDNGNDGVVIYAETKIVEWRDGKITLRSGGWETVTTKRKMNQASNQFALGFGVWQKDHEWFVNLPDGDTVPFEDGMTFDARPGRFI